MKGAIFRLTAALAAVLTLLSGCTGGAEPDPTPTLETIHIYGSYIPVMKEVPKCKYAADCFSNADGFMEYSDGEIHSEAVIDVSEFQGEIDWNAVAESGIKMAVIRVGYRGYSAGGIYEDAMFRKNAEEAKKAGLQVGAYFFSQAVTPEEAEEEADFLIDAVSGLDITGPAVFDWEAITEEDSRTAAITGETVTESAVKFCSRLADAGLDPWVYMGREAGYLLYDLSRLTEYKLWFAQYGGTPDFYYNFHMWQYTDSGSVPGIQGGVDLNMLFVRDIPPEAAAQ